MTRYAVAYLNRAQACAEQKRKRILKLKLKAQPGKFVLRGESLICAVCKSVNNFLQNNTTVG